MPHNNVPTAAEVRRHRRRRRGTRGRRTRESSRRAGRSRRDETPSAPRAVAGSRFRMDSEISGGPRASVPAGGAPPSGPWPDSRTPYVITRSASPTVLVPGGSHSPAIGNREERKRVAQPRTRRPDLRGELSRRVGRGIQTEKTTQPGPFAIDGRGLPRSRGPGPPKGGLRSGLDQSARQGRRLQCRVALPVLRRQAGRGRDLGRPGVEGRSARARECPRCLAAPGPRGCAPHDRRLPRRPALWSRPSASDAREPRDRTRRRETLSLHPEGPGAAGGRIGPACTGPVPGADGRGRAAIDVPVPVDPGRLALLRRRGARARLAGSAGSDFDGGRGPVRGNRVEPIGRLDRTRRALGARRRGRARARREPRAPPAGGSHAGLAHRGERPRTSRSVRAGRSCRGRDALGARRTSVGRRRRGYRARGRMRLGRAAAGAT